VGVLRLSNLDKCVANGLPRVHGGADTYAFLVAGVAEEFLKV
jgi:hypothetical protein